MASEIIETYKLLQEKIKSENAKVFFDMLDSPYPAFKSRAIQELTKLKIDTPIIKEYLNDSDAGVRLSSLKYLEKMNLLEENQLKAATKDLAPSLRREAIKMYITSGYEPIDYVFSHATDPEPTVRYQLLVSFLEFYPEESEKILKLLKDDPYIKIQQLIYALENISETIKSKDVQLPVKKMAMARYFESNDSITFFNLIKEVYPECEKATQIMIIKFMATIPCDIIKSFVENKINEEKDNELLIEFVKTIKKVCGSEGLPSWIIETFINEKDPKLISFGLKLASEKDDMSYVEFSRDLLKKIDDDYVLGSATYLAYFQDYKLMDYVPEFLESLSSKRINTGIRIIKKLKLENFVPEVAQISENKKYPTTVRKNALNTLKYFKAKQYWEIPYNILKDPSERGDLKLTALNALLKLNAEMVTNL